MSGGIKSLADEIREQIRAESAADPQDETVITHLNASNSPVLPSVTDIQITQFFTDLDAFEFKGTQKSLIRVDVKTMNLLKRLKLAKGVDMNKFIVYSLHQFIAQHRWLANYIRETLKNSDI